MEILDVLRQEKKFELNYIETENLCHRLNQTVQKDSYSMQENGYKVRSLYFDTMYNRDFWQKSDGISDRRKVRLRVYGPDSEVVKLELKEKQGDFQRKRSLLLSREEAEKMILGDYLCLQQRSEEFAHEMYGLLETNLYRPVCIVEYDRRAWCVPENDIRLTLDGNIRATESSYDLFSKNLCLFPVGCIYQTILEVKFNRFLLSYVRDLLGSTRRVQVSASKYAMGRGFTMGSIL